MSGARCFVVLLVVLLIGTGLADISGKRYVITDFGAVGDAARLNTQVIQSVIDLCASEGGGVVVVPKGVFLSGALFLKQGVNLHIEEEGVLKGTVNPDDYPQVLTRWEGVEREWT